MGTVERGGKRVARGAITLGVLVVSWVSAFALRFEFAIPGSMLTVLIATLIPVVMLKWSLLRYLRVDRHSWQQVSLEDVLGIASAMVAASSFLVALRVLLPASPWEVAGDTLMVPLGVIGMDLALSLIGLVGVRVLRRVQTERRHVRRLARRSRLRRVLLVGAGHAGGMVARELAGRPDLGLQPVGFLDDNPALQGRLVQGLEVRGATRDLADVVNARAVDEVIITTASAPGEFVRSITERCREVGVDVRIVPGVSEILGGTVNLSRLRPVRIEDLLRREPVELDGSSIAGAVTGRTVLVTGAGGSIGAELCRQLVTFGPERLVMVEQAETNLWAIDRELAAHGLPVDLVPAIADVCDRGRMDHLVTEHRPVAIFHAAAHKHVHMMERNPGEAIKNNVFGTKLVADLAVEHGVERFVLISTDKAVNPSSVMGMSKRVAERYVQDLARRSGRNLVSVRFGNVLGSAGSVVPIFEQQIAAGGPVTITDPEMRRYFMTIPEAAQLVIQAAAIGDGGEIFVLDMGEPVRIVDLARDLIRLSGLVPDEDILIEFTGARPGEKLFEELSLLIENAERTKHPKILTGCSPQPQWPTVESDLSLLEELSARGDDPVVRAGLMHLIPELRGRAPEPLPEHPL